MTHWAQEVVRLAVRRICGRSGRDRRFSGAKRHALSEGTRNRLDPVRLATKRTNTLSERTLLLWMVRGDL
jgi:hypothetical protein